MSDTKPTPAPSLNERLNELRILYRRILNAHQEGESIDTGDAVTLAERVEQLDQWMTGGGAAPWRWGQR